MCGEAKAVVHYEKMLCHINLNHVQTCISRRCSWLSMPHGKLSMRVYLIDVPSPDDLLILYKIIVEGQIMCDVSSAMDTSKIRLRRLKCSQQISPRVVTIPLSYERRHGKHAIVMKLRPMISDYRLLPESC
jgi:hypothetical protein